MQPSATPEPLAWEDLGAVAEALRTYVRRIPAERVQGHGFIFVSIARFECSEAAATALQAVEEDDFSSVREFWPTVDVMEVDVSLSQEAASRQLLSGTISQNGASMYSDFLQIQVDDLVATVTGQSSNAPITLETAYIGHIVYSLMEADEDEVLELLLPPEDQLIGGLQVAD